ncbi:chemotaxis protein CheA [Vulgatibacter sp.]|uniref:chemotaxis protein CheA n=1 Tax=Vulgatibacter sp. TaxID=1971226 RepID=UPI003562024C
MSQPPDLKTFLGGFLVEAEEYLRSANAQLVALDGLVRRGEAGHRQVRELFRAMHTIKGLAAMVGVEPIVAIAHALETVLRKADRAGGALDARTLDLLQQAVRAVEERVRALEERKQVLPEPAALIDALERLPIGEGPREAIGAEELLLESALLERLSAAERAELLAAHGRGRRAVRVDFAPSPERAREGMNITRVREDVARLAEIVKVVPLSRPATPEAPGGLAFALLVVTDADDEALAAAAGAEGVVPLRGEAPQPVPPLPALEEAEGGAFEPRNRRYVRVDVGRLDEALEKLSALVVTRHRLERAVADLAGRSVDVRELAFVVADNARQLRDLRAAIMGARLVPVEELLERVPLIVRGLARGTGKQVRLDIDAGRAELDKAVGERLFPAIVHLVRNAVDHGLETPAERVAAGKPEEGHLRIHCAERGNNQLELVIADDGRGIDREAVARKAGVPVPESDEALIDLLARPGFSTRDETTTTSGRGMGVDIVKRVAVAELGGEFSLQTQAGRGTTFVLRVPLSITIIDAFAFQAGGQTFVVPVATVEELVELADAQVTVPPGHGALRLLRRRDETVPLVDLAARLQLPRQQQERPKAIVVRRNGEPFAFEVDRMRGQQEVVVRPIEDPLVQVPGVSGTADLGDGKPTLVLDLLALRASGTGEVQR